jgi:hypothetical protein
MTGKLPGKYPVNAFPDRLKFVPNATPTGGTFHRRKADVYTFGCRTGDPGFGFPLARLRLRRSSGASSRRFSERDRGCRRGDSGRPFLNWMRPDSLRSWS